MFTITLIYESQATIRSALPPHTGHSEDNTLNGSLLG